MDESKPSFSPGRRWLKWFNLIFGVAAVLALVAMANYLSSRHFKRFQLGSNSLTKLSPQTVSLLQRTNKIDVTIFFDQQANEEIYSLVSALLKQYSYADPNLTVQGIDYTRSPGKAGTILAKYKLSNLKDKNFVVFDSGGKSKVILGNELYDYDLNSVLSGQSNSVRRNAFKGELLFSSAIFAVTDPRQTRAYFLYGHGEHDPENSGQDLGYAKFAAVLKDEANIEWEKLSLFGTNAIPADCQLLIVARPDKAQFQDSELEKIEAYLQQGRRLLVLLNNTALGGDSGIEKTLAKWNVGVANYKIEDKGFSPTGDDLVPAQLNGNHPVLKSIVAEKLQIYLVLPRTVFPTKTVSGARAVDAPQVEILATTSTNAVRSYKTQSADGKFEAHESTAIFSLIVAVEYGSIKNVSTERGVTRILVLGDSLCFDNQLIDTAANHYFANSAVNWLVDQPQMLLAGIGPRPIQEYKLVLTPAQMFKLKWILLAGMPGAVLLIGGLVWLGRRN